MSEEIGHATPAEAAPKTLTEADPSEAFEDMEVDAPQVGVHGGASSWQPSGRIGGESTSERDHTQQVGLRPLRPAAHARALRTRRTSRGRVYRAHSPGGSGAPSASLWMSIRQPVSRAASRAFWPSLPIASESW